MNESRIKIREVVKQSQELLLHRNEQDKAIEIIQNALLHVDDEFNMLKLWLALSYVETANLDKAIEIYNSLEAYYQIGFCEVLQGNLSAAVNAWRHCPDSEVRHWAKCLETILKGYIHKVPTFLNVRNHLEADLGYLLRFNQIEYGQSIINLADNFEDINLESYKFIARAMLHNGHENMSVHYLIKAQQILPNDPEVYYHLGQYSMFVDAPKEAETMFKHCLLLSPTYTPAKDRLKELKKKKRFL